VAILSSGVGSLVAKKKIAEYLGGRLHSVFTHYFVFCLRYYILMSIFCGSGAINHSNNFGFFNIQLMFRMALCHCSRRNSILETEIAKIFG